VRKTLAQKFKDILGAENFSTDESDRVCYSFDSSSYRYIPEAVALPGNTEEVSRLLKVAYEEGIPVFPRGAGTGTTGGAVPWANGIALSLARMDRVLSISVEDLVAVVEPGVVTGHLQREVARSNLFYPPDPASLNFCTIGGNIATGAGGARAVKYGVTKDYVMGLEVVLSDGSLMNIGSNTAKSVVGYDLTKLMVGSEGTLGVVTRATLKLIPMPESVGTMLAFFPSTLEASEALTNLFSMHILPRCAELLDEKCLRLTADRLPVKMASGSRALLILEVDGPRESIKRQLDDASAACSKANAQGVVIATDPKKIDEIWSVRRSLSPAISKLGYPDKISEDICVPRHNLTAIMDRLSLIEKKFQVCLLVFGHAGDGNLHVNILFDKARREEQKAVEGAVEAIMKSAVELGGTISGEHGIGISKKEFLPLEITEPALTLMKSVKQIFDPKNILNPGKIFPNGAYKEAN